MGTAIYTKAPIGIVPGVPPLPFTVSILETIPFPQPYAGPYIFNNTQYLVVGKDGTPFFQVWKTLDNGANWEIQDDANSVASNSQVYQSALVENEIQIIYQDENTGFAAFNTFDLTTDTWGIPILAASTLYVDGFIAILCPNEEWVTISTHADSPVLFNVIRFKNGAWLPATDHNTGITSPGGIVPTRGVADITNSIHFVTQDYADGFNGLGPTTFKYWNLNDSDILSSPIIISSTDAFSGWLGGPLIIWNGKLFIPTINPGNLPNYYPGTPGVWVSNLPVSSFTFIAADTNPTNYPWYGCTLVILNNTQATLFWTSNGFGASLDLAQLMMNSFDGTTFGSTQLYYDSNQNGPYAYPGDNGQIISPTSITLVSNSLGYSYGIALGLTYDEFNHRSTFYLQPNIQPNIIQAGVIRLQLFEDGSGEYLFNEDLNSQLCSGNQTNTLLNAGGAVGPFILKSPLPIIKPGMLTIQITNVNPPNNPVSISAYVGLVFATPRRCGQNNKGKGVMTR